jgi:hypothetical protein
MLNLSRRQRSTGGRRDGPVLEPAEVRVHPRCNAKRVFDGTALELGDVQVYLSSVGECVLNAVGIRKENKAIEPEDVECVVEFL